MSNVKTAMRQIDERPLTGHQRSLIALTVVGNISEFFDLFIIGFVIALLMKSPGWELTGFQAGIIGAASGVGTVIGAIMWGRLADRFGRKTAFAACIVVLVIFTALCLTVMPGQWLMLTLYRIGACIGVGGLNVTSIPYVQEFVPSKQRGLLAGLTSVFIPLGIFLGSLATKILGEPLGWKGLIALGCLPVVLVVWVFFVPESPRYLMSRGRVEDARKAYAWAMNIPVTEVGELPEYEQKPATSYGVIFSKYPKQLAIVTFGSFCFILGSFTIQSWGQAILGESFKFDIGTVAYLFMGVSLADLLGRLGSAWISDHIGRRKTMLVWGVLGGVGCLIAAFASQIQGSSAGWIFFLGILIAMAFGDGAFGILNAFGSEQFPNEVRSTGLGLGYGIGATAKIFGPYLIGAMIGGGKPTPEVVFVPFIMFAVLLFVGAGIYMLAKETKAIRLEDV